MGNTYQISAFLLECQFESCHPVFHFASAFCRKWKWNLPSDDLRERYLLKLQFVGCQAVELQILLGVFFIFDQNFHFWVFWIAQIHGAHFCIIFFGSLKLSREAHDVVLTLIKRWNNVVCLDKNQWLVSKVSSSSVFYTFCIEWL